MEKTSSEELQSQGTVACRKKSLIWPTVMAWCWNASFTLV